MIIITDGQDMGSRATARQAIEAALKSNTICYVLIVGDSRYMTASSYDGVGRMKTLASETGAPWRSSTTPRTTRSGSDETWRTIRSCVSGSAASA